MWKRLLERARAQGPIPEGYFRVMTIESDGRVGLRDFDSLERARGYADDAAAEAEGASPVAIVVGPAFDVVHEGRPYFLR